jgi:hypothetical protein
MNHKINLLDNIIHTILRREAVDRQSLSLLYRNMKFKGIHKNKRCFVIGNGSSLKSQNLHKLDNEITFVMNAFWKHPVISSTWQPKYYCFADNISFDGSKSFMDFFRSLRKVITSSNFFVPIGARETITRQNLLPMESTNYVKFRNDGCYDEIDLTLPIPSIQSTSQLAIEAAIYMGCNPIYLLGLDHDWLSHRGMDKHFYAGKTVENHKVVHGDLSKYNYKNEMKSMIRLWEKYENLKVLAERNSVRIFNCTNGGFLDVFPRKDFSAIINSRS